MDRRLRNEINHGRYLAEKGAAKVWNWDTPAGRKRRERRAAMVSSPLAGGMKVLELGCGSGTFTGDIAATGAQVTAIDISPDLLDQAGKAVGSPNVEFRMEDASNLSFADASFDAVVGVSVLHHLDVPKALTEISRVLRPGGVMRFSEPNMMNPQIALERKVPAIRRMTGNSPDETAFFRWKLKGMLREMGFDEITVVPFDFLHPSVPASLVPAVDAFGRFLEKIPFVAEIAGSLFIAAVRGGGRQSG